MYSFWRLRIMRHAHSGRRAHAQHTSYPMVALLLLVGALLLVPPTSAVFAAGNPDSLVVTAVVSGPPPTQAATIDEPLEGTDFTTKPITVTGTCPATTYVQLFRNGVPSGTALCSTTGTYSLTTDLFAVNNELYVRVYNYAGVAGPDSTKIHVTYTAPVVPDPPVTGDNGGSTGSTGSTGGNTGTGQTGGSTGTTKPAPSTGGTTQPTVTAPLLLRNDYVFTGFYVGQAMTQRIGINGGSAPYSVNVKWGDGSETLYTSKSADTLTLSHTYTNQSPRDSGYVISINATDVDGNTASLQILAIVNDVPGTGSTSGSSTGAGAATTIFGTTVRQLVFYIWSTYGTVCLVVFGFWLGEVRELRLIKNRFRLQRL